MEKVTLPSATPASMSNPEMVMAGHVSSSKDHAAALADDRDDDECDGEEIEKAPSKPAGLSLLTDWNKGYIGWDSDADPANPKNWPKRIKIRVMVFVLVTAFMIPTASTLFVPGESMMAKEFGLTNTVIKQFTISAYVLGFGWGPLMHAPLSELYGRKYVVVCSNFFFAVLNIGCSEATNVTMFLIFRALSGVLGCAGMVVGAGIISDMYRPEETGRATALFLMGPICGPVVGPILGGFISQHAGWRWTFRVIECLGGVMMTAFIFFVKETNAAILFRRKANRLAKSMSRPELISIMDSRNPPMSPARKLAMGLLRAAKLLCTSPVVFSLSIYMLIAYSYLYVFFTTITTVLTTRYGWSIEMAGLSFIGIGCGTVFSVAVVGSTNDRLVEYLTNRNNGIREPEMRLGPMIFGSIMIPVSMFWYGWGVEKHIHWLPLIMSFFPIGAGLLASLIPIQAYLIDLYAPLGAAASATAALNILRCTAAALIPMCVPALIARFDYGWGYSLFGFLAVGLCSTMSVFFVKFGKQFRQRYPPRI
ncbi:major facilitator superfamily domain-containing protein [Lipomyces tetrasporus]|uniref:Major facilitator superfamily domain-containing protein n=1 Tax=Lipomyces tetrasporus TaxID=54092 RepID=A0AAD7VUT3_9ASCO|nr:major facilitator superfamily domain-containing protein [Lipomyces tetrasporus]KAJ8102818.1 major facilitator superfamily domain-containing protein [Lipomyces tetrasporus]